MFDWYIASMKETGTKRHGLRFKREPKPKLACAPNMVGSGIISSSKSTWALSFFAFYS
jgi:hypothetical protein